MVRRRWKAVETPSGWFDIIRGPRPPSQKWPLARPAQWVPHQPPVHTWVPQRRWNVGVRWKFGHQQGGPSTVKLNPDEKCAAAQLKVERLEAALAAFGNENSPEKEAIEGFLILARAQAKVRPVEERLKACEEYLARFVKRLEEVQGEVERTRERLSRLREEASVKRQTTTPPPDLEAEVSQLRAELAEAKGEAAGWECARVRQRVMEPRRDTEPIPQELWEWMSCKQQELQDILQFGGSWNKVLELTSQLAEAADRLHSLQDDVVMR